MMTSLVARRTDDGWKASLSAQASPEAPGLPQASLAGRAKAWELARDLGRTRSPWQLECQKAALGSPEITLGYAHLLAEGCEAGAAQASERSLSVPALYADARVVNRELACRGLARQGLARAQALLDRLRFLVAATGAAASLVAYTLTVGRRMRGAAAPVAGDTALALHGERATRTQHLLKAGIEQARPCCIVVIGRLRTSLATLREEWAAMAGAPVPRLVHPFSATAAVRAVPRMLRLLAEGWREAPRHHYLPGAREHLAIVFRVLLGAAMEQWWKMHGTAVDTVFFGHTGVADTTALEAAMQARGTRTIHVVHGLATGPNFPGFSDVAWFRCGFDAEQYARLGTYGECLVQEAPAPQPVRGREGIYLLTNLAHPMNPGFIARGPEDEIALLRLVAAAARKLGPPGQRMLWRPHPVLRRLPADVSAQIRQEASRLGFVEQDHAEPMGPAAAGARWVITSPSTTAIDLLVQGTLCVVVDLQESAAGTAPAQFPCPPAHPDALGALLRELDEDATYQARFTEVWNSVRPARPLDLARPPSNGA
ncbi:hypothetical protein [Ramlibacter alkalitolerans]|uniref:Uncharacterized protein n=1 Tax=Ramlibacter alkalitolerans TaxID=2039631 RepID=A0ABS1JPK6_9BURK|nr:hypothetical protein [Ramlibacter alkalitolerans]MBL0425791.1 hypothetical protein [Ramlibacter alkalitolerans]